MSQLSYREATTGMPPVDWRQELIACSPWDYKRLYRLKKLAGEWAHCPVGHLSPKFPRYPDGLPIDPELQRLGIEFFECLDSERLGHANEALTEIIRYGLLHEPKDHEHLQIP